MEIPNLGYSQQYKYPKNPLSVPHPSGWLVCGGVGSGKSNLVTVCLQTKEYSLWDKIYYYTRSLEDHKLDGLRAINERYKKKLNKYYEKHEIEQEAEDIIVIDDGAGGFVPFEELQTTTDDGRAFRNIIVFDDYIGMDTTTLNSITQYFIKRRHLSATCVFLTQRYFATPITIRQNCDTFSLFASNSKTDRDLICSQLLTEYDKETAQQIFTSATAQQFSFLHIDRKTSVKTLSVRTKMDKLLIGVGDDGKPIWEQAHLKRRHVVVGGTVVI